MVRPGDLYAALPGTRVHGAEFSAAAVAAGAVAILTDPAGRDRAAASGRAGLRGDRPAGPAGRGRLLGVRRPRRRLRLIGVTGTSGKTTTSYLARGRAADGRARDRPDRRGGDPDRRPSVQASELTTPEATDLQALLATMAERGVTAAAMEVSSHALALGRVAGTHYDVAIFTNLSQDHLDFHADLEDYFAAKARLFTPRVRRRGGGQPRRRLRAAARGRARRSRSPPSPRPATRTRTGGPRTCGSGADGSTFRVIGPGGVEADALAGPGRPVQRGQRAGAIVALVEAGIGLDDAVAGVSGPAPACPAGWSGSSRWAAPHPT